MKVYVVLRGEEHEGEDIIGIFKTKKKAIKFARKQECCFNSEKCYHGSWEEHISYNGI